MPRKKTTPVIQSHTPAQTTPPAQTSPVSRKIMFGILAVVLIALYVYFRTNLINVATVDGSPVSRWELEKELNSKYADQTLDTLVSEKIILTQAQKKGVSVNQKEVDDRVKEIEKRLAGQMSLDEALKAQGLTQDSFRKQIEIQLIIDKLFSKEAIVSDKEVNEYIAQNQETLQSSTDEAALKKDVKEMLKQQKIGELFDKWFADLRKKVNIVKL